MILFNPQKNPNCSLFYMNEKPEWVLEKVGNCPNMMEQVKQKNRILTPKFLLYYIRLNV